MILFSEHTQIISTHTVKLSPSVCSIDSFQYPFVSGVPQTTFRLDISLEVSATFSQRACINSLPSGVLKTGTHPNFDKLGGLLECWHSECLVRSQVQGHTVLPSIAACSPRPRDHTHAVWSSTSDRQI